MKLSQNCHSFIWETDIFNECIDRSVRSHLRHLSSTLTVSTNSTAPENVIHLFTMVRCHSFRITTNRDFDTDFAF